MIKKKILLADDMGTIHVSQPLSNVAVEFKQPKNIWNEVMKPVPVDKENDTYYIFGDEDFRYHGKKRADGDPAVRILPFTASTDTYACIETAYDVLLTKRQINKADKIVMLKNRSTNRLMNIIDRDIEIEVAAEAFGASNYTGMTAAPSTKWDTKLTGSPISDIDTAKTLVQAQIGIDPNVIVMGREVYDQLKRHAELKEIVKYTKTAAFITPELMASIFGVDKVVVGDQIYITSKPGQTTVTRSYVWGKSCALLYVPQASAIDEPAWGYTFMHKLFGKLTAKVKNYPEHKLNGEILEASRSFVPKVTGKKAGYLYTTVVN